GNYIEFSSFPRPSNGPEQLRLGTSDNPPNNNSNHAIASGHLPPAKRLKVRAQADERRKNKDQIADSALTIAKKNVPKAMKYVRKKLPYEFMQRNGNFHKPFTYINNEARERKKIPVKEYIWDLSFPDCTKELHAAVTDWLNENFRAPHRPKYLIIIGPSIVGMIENKQIIFFLDDYNKRYHYLLFLGKTWFALPLPGRVTDKYERTVTIDVTAPSIVLLNPGNDGSLSNKPVTRAQIADAEYWARRAVVYRMGEDEHFYKVQPASASGTMDASIVNHRRPLIGRPDEFEITRREWLDAQNHRRAAVVSDSFDRSSAMDVEGISDESDIEIL
ncbi:unnamed protein product, partial [Rotaria sp. Silwood2]